MNDERARECLRRCYEEATKSPDPSTQIGAALSLNGWGLLPGTLAHNKPSRGWSMSVMDWERPRKYNLMCHAERGSLDKAAVLGIATAGSIMIATWAACADCSRGIVACGVSTLVRHVADTGAATSGWEDSVAIGDEIMRAGGVNLLNIFGPIPGAPKVLRSGELIDPSEGL